MSLLLEIKRMLTIDSLTGTDNKLVSDFKTFLNNFTWAKSGINDTDYLTVLNNRIGDHIRSRCILYYDVENNILWYDRVSLSEILGKITQNIPSDEFLSPDRDDQYSQILEIVIRNYMYNIFGSLYPEHKQKLDKLSIRQNYKRITSSIERAIIYYHGSNT